MYNTQDDISDEQLLSALKKAIDDFPPRHPEAEALNVMEYSQALELRKARAVAALAREGWRPIPKDEGAAISLFERRSNPCPLVETAADAEAHGLAKQLQELADILTLMGFVTLAPPAWPTRLQRAAELLVYQQAPAPVPARLRCCPTHGQQAAEAWGCPECVREMRTELTELLQQRNPAPVLTRERPWEREGWLDQEGRCWMGDPGGGEFIPSWRLCCPWAFCNLKWSLPHWAISVPSTCNESCPLSPQFTQ